MIPEERLKRIFAILSANRRITLSDFAAKLYVSEMTARRIVAELIEDNMVTLEKSVIRTVEQNLSSHIATHSEDDDTEMLQRRNAAQQASMIVRSGDTIWLDGSTACRFLAQYLVNRRDITLVLGCSFRLIDTCVAGCAPFYVLGSHVIKKKYFDFDMTPYTVFLREHTIDAAFFSGQGYVPDDGVYTIEREAAETTKYVLGVAKRRYYLCSDSKIGFRGNFRVCRESDLTAVFYGGTGDYRQKYFDMCEGGK